MAASVRSDHRAIQSSYFYTTSYFRPFKVRMWKGTRWSHKDTRENILPTAKVGICWKAELQAWQRKQISVTAAQTESYNRLSSATKPSQQMHQAALMRHFWLWTQYHDQRSAGDSHIIHTIVRIKCLARLFLLDGLTVRFDLIPSNAEAPWLIFDISCFY